MFITYTVYILCNAQDNREKTLPFITRTLLHNTACLDSFALTKQYLLLLLVYCCFYSCGI